MGVIFVPFGDWKPDGTRFGYGELKEALNVLPIEDRYVPMRNLRLAISHGAFIGTGINSSYLHRYWLDSTISGKIYYDDATMLYGGSLTKLFEDTYESDRTRTRGAYGSGTYAPLPWRFASWGRKVVATNFSDQVQVLQAPAGHLVANNFADMISAGIQTITISSGGSGYATPPAVAITSGGGTGATATCTILAGVVNTVTVTAAGSGYTFAPTVAFSGGGGSGAAAAVTATTSAIPQARFVTVLGQHVVLANIRLPFDAGVIVRGDYPQHIWWSKTDDETKFGDPATNAGWNSDFQPLADLTGQITGLVKIGDEHLAIFSADSVGLMSRTGGDDLFSFRILHRGSNAGTIYPASIVVQGEDVYYWSTAGNIMKMTNLNAPERVGYGKITSWLQDSVNNPTYYFDTRSITAGTDSIFGFYDESSQCVGWMYPAGSPGGTPVPKFLFYNVLTDRFSHGDCRTASADIMAKTITNEGSYTLTTNGDIYVFGSPLAGTDGSMRLGETLKTKTIGLIPEDPSQLGLEYKTAQVTRVRPIMREYSTGFTTDPKIVITYSMRPNMADSLTSTMDPANGYAVNADGWYTIPEGKIVGQYFEIQVSRAVGTNDNDLSSDVEIGLLVDVQEAGVGHS
jgi:hypothetical protein